MEKILRRKFRGDIMKYFSKKNIVSVLIIFIAYVAIKLMMDQGIIDSLMTLNMFFIGINIILAVSLNLITGFTGQFSLGHAAFMAIGAYTSAILTSNFNQSLAAGIIAAAVIAAIAGVLIGIPTLRLRGDYLAIATLGFGEIVKVVILNNDYLGGATGINDIPVYTDWTWLYFSTVITVILINNFIKSYHGRACIAIREDEIAAEATGVNTTFYKVLAFAIGAAFAGVAGALHANLMNFITPDSFGFMKSIDILIIVVFGGLGSMLGSIIGAVALSLISLSLQSFPQIRMILYSAILFLIMLYRPEGLLGKKEFKFFKRRSLNASVNSKKSN